MLRVELDGLIPVSARSRSVTLLFVNHSQQEGDLCFLRRHVLGGSQMFDGLVKLAGTQRFKTFCHFFLRFWRENRFAAHGIGYTTPSIWLESNNEQLLAILRRDFCFKP